MKKTFMYFFVAVVFTACQKQRVDTVTPVSSEPTVIQNGTASVSETANSATPESFSTIPPCVVAVETPLMAGQSINVGLVTVTNDETNVYVTYQTSGSYLVKKTHLFVGSCDDIPVNNSGNPRIGQYPYQTTHGIGVASYTYTIPRSSLPAGCLCVSAHAEVVAYNAAGTVIFSQTGWGFGEQINDGGSWAMKFDYCQQECEGDGGPR
jgi:hypothetical protein